MEDNTGTESLFSRLGERVRPGWQRFLRWRRERWRVRAVIVLLLGLYFVLGPNIVELIDIAIQSIFASSEPKVMTSGACFHKAMEADRLRRALRAHTRAEGDKVARDLGIAPRDVEGPSLALDLGKLVGAARSAGLVQDSYTTRTVRRRALALGRADAEGLFGPARAETAEMLESADSPANWSVKSWLLEARRLLSVGLWVIGPGDWVTSALFLLFCYSACRAAAAVGRMRVRWVVPSVLAACTFVTIVLVPPIWKSGYALMISSRLLLALGWSVFVFAVGYSGSRSRPPEARSAAQRFRAFLPIAVCPAAWGMLSLVKRPISLWMARPGFGRSPSCVFLVWIIPLWLNVAFAVLGVAGLVAILALSRRQAALES